MIFRFNNPFPNGKFEFTCVCGKWNTVLIRTCGYIPTTELQTFKCRDTGCNVEVIIWEQRTHWHMELKGVG